MFSVFLKSHAVCKQFGTYCTGNLTLLPVGVRLVSLFWRNVSIWRNKWLQNACGYILEVSLFWSTLRPYLCVLLMLSDTVSVLCCCHQKCVVWKGINQCNSVSLLSLTLHVDSACRWKHDVVHTFFLCIHVEPYHAADLAKW